MKVVKLTLSDDQIATLTNIMQHSHELFFARRHQIQAQSLADIVIVALSVATPVEPIKIPRNRFDLLCAIKNAQSVIRLSPEHSWLVKGQHITTLPDRCVRVLIKLGLAEIKADPMIATHAERLELTQHALTLLSYNYRTNNGSVELF